MSESSDLRQRAKSAFQHAKQTVGVGDPPLATEVGGRVKAVREALLAFGQGDHDRFLSALGENVEWVAPRGENFPGGGQIDGRDAVKERFIGTVERSYAEFGFSPERYLESPDENLVMVVGTFGGQGVKGPSQFEAPCVQIWEFDGDNVVGVQIFTDSDAFPEVVQEDEPQPDEQEDEDSDESKGSSEDKDSDGEDKESEKKESEGESGSTGEGKSSDGESKSSSEGKSLDMEGKSSSEGKETEGESKSSSEGKPSDGESGPSSESKSSEGESKSSGEGKPSDGESRSSSESKPSDGESRDQGSSS